MNNANERRKLHEFICLILQCKYGPEFSTRNWKAVQFSVHSCRIYSRKLHSTEFYHKKKHLNKYIASFGEFPSLLLAFSFSFQP